MKASFLVSFALATSGLIAQSSPFAITEIQRNADDSVTLTWNSVPGKWYQLEYSPDLTTWQTIADLVVSQGTSSQAADAGRYDLTPKLKRPFQPGETRRFWRAREIGENQGTAPTVSLTTPSNNDTVSGEITVSATTSGTSPVDVLSLYVDGELVAEQNGPDADFTLNTSEWANGAHKIYVLGGDSGSVSTTPSSSSDTTTNYGVSATLNLTFDNFVSEFFFSEPYFRPDLGETQTISAKFKESANWTLTVTNSSSTAVFTTTGTGSSVSYTWNGKDTGGNDLPFDLYRYEITTDYEPPALRSSGGSFSISSTGSGSGGNSRNGTPNVGTALTFGAAYQGHHPETGGFQRPKYNPFSSISFVPINYPPPFGPLKNVGRIASGFTTNLKKFGGFTAGSAFGASGILADDAVTGANLRAPGNVFNTVNIGLLIGHGVQGNRADLASGAAIETYYPVFATGGSEYDWVRIHEFQFGGSLRWMGIFACNMVGDTAVANWNTHANWPFDPSQLHLLLSASTSVYMVESFGTNWSWAMTGKLKGYPAAQSVRRSWLLAGYVTQALAGGGKVDLRVIGSTNCTGETIKQNISPNGIIAIETTTVYDPSSTTPPPS